MRIHELIKNNSNTVTVEGLSAIVEWYIYETKKRVVNIDIYQDCLIARNKLNPILFKLRVNQLFRCYIKALEYYNSVYLGHEKH